MSSVNTPIVAVMLTQAGREGLAVRAMHNFTHQQITDKQLIVGVPRAESEEATYAYSSLFLKFLYPPTRVLVFNVDGSPAEMLQQLVAKARELSPPPNTAFCFWDDDDQSHPLRLQRQLASVKPGRLSFLSAAMYHFYDTAELFVVERERQHYPMDTRVLMGSMVAHLADVPESFKLPSIGNPGHHVARQMLTKTGNNPARALGEYWWMKIGVRGDNAQGYEHHRAQVMTEPYGMDAGWNFERQTLSSCWLDGYHFDPGELTVCGRDGTAFEYHPKQIWSGDLPPVGVAPGIEHVQE